VGWVVGRLLRLGLGLGLEIGHVIGLEGRLDNWEVG
jgi:hypothetical protein